MRNISIPATTSEFASRIWVDHLCFGNAQLSDLLERNAVVMHPFVVGEIACSTQHEGEELISRSQAKFVARRFERCRHVVLDFEGVAEIGQAFADELFRVFAAAHPEVRLISANTTPAVAQMISRALKAAESSR